MDERHKRIEALFHEALERQPDRRAKFLAEACPDDPSLRGEVESLLSSREATFLSKGAVAAAEPYRSLIGRNLSHFEVLDHIGSGGMGDVYLANDKRLSRRVALKVLPAELALSGERRARFEREAKAIAALNHPSIVHIYSIEEADGVSFMTLELVEGRTLSAVIGRKGLPLKTFLEIATAMTEALRAAHAAGVVHRDLKPDNVMVTEEGAVKVLDFGLAKLQQDMGEALVTNPPSLSETNEGRIMGTVAYMSPEQAEGNRVDSRTDIFSLGVVLYETATGEKPFKGDSTASILSSILRDTPVPASRVNPRLPDKVSRVIQRCLEKNPDRRFQTASELRGALQLAGEEGGSTWLSYVRRVAFQNRAIRTTLAIGAVAVAVALVVVLESFSKPEAPRAGRPSSHSQVTFDGSASIPAISADGTLAAYVTGPSNFAPGTSLSGRTSQTIVLQDLVGKQSLELYEGRAVRSIRWSPDGSQIAFSDAGDSLSVGTYVVSRLGGVPRRIASYPMVAWSPDGTRIAGGFTIGKDIDLLDVRTAESTFLPLTGEFDFLTDLDWSPRGDQLLFSTEDHEGRHAISTIAIDGTGQATVVEEDSAIMSPRWSANAESIYYLRATGDLWKVSRRRRTDQPWSEPLPVLTGLQAGDSFTLAADGRSMLYTRETGSSNLHVVESGGTHESLEQLTTGTFFHSQPSVSPDGERIAFSRGDGRTSNIFVMPITGGPPTQLTFFRSQNESPAWSPDGSEIAFGSTEGEKARVWRVASNGGTPRPFPDTTVSSSLTVVWSPGENILYQQSGNRNFAVLDPVSGSQRPLIEGGSRLGFPFSPAPAPNGRRVALMWNHVEVRGLWIVSPKGDYPLTGTLHTATVRQSLKASDYRGKRIRLRARVKARTQLFLHVRDTRDDSVFYAEQEAPLESDSWEAFELVGGVTNEAETITFGAFLSGAGEAWLDRVQLQVREEGAAWTDVEVRNPGFEEEDDGAWHTAPGGLSGEDSERDESPGFSFRLTTEDADQGDRALLIEGRSDGLPAGEFVPIGWSSDGLWVYAMDVASVTIVRIPATGGEPITVAAPLQAGQEMWGAAVTPDSERFVLAIREVQSDIWRVENFDSGVR